MSVTNTSPSSPEAEPEDAAATPRESDEAAEEARSRERPKRAVKANARAYGPD
jgi:hypothetical protein